LGQVWSPAPIRIVRPDDWLRWPQIWEALEFLDGWQAAVRLTERFQEERGCLREDFSKKQGELYCERVVACPSIQS
jgi:hypothetical protein